jgi:hypothetical protein
VISRSREVTSNQAEAVEEVDIPLLGMHANMKTAKLTEQGDISNARKTVQNYSSLISKNVQSASEQAQYNAWNDGNLNLLQSPSVLAQEQIQQQAPFAFPPQQQQQQGFFSFGPPQPTNTNNNNSNSFFSFGSGAQQPAPQPQQQQQSNSFFSGFNFPWGGSNTSNSSVSPSFQQPQQQQQQYDDMTSNQIYQQKDNRKNQKQWSRQRKF